MKYIDADKLIAEIERRITETENLGELERANELIMLETFITPLIQEQESVAERFAKIARGNLTEIGENAQKQFEQLFFEITNEKMYGGYKD